MTEIDVMIHRIGTRPRVTEIDVPFAAVERDARPAMVAATVVTRER